MKMLISGANGALGKRMVWFMQNQNGVDEIIIIGRTQPAWLETQKHQSNASKPLRFIKVDLENAEAIANLPAYATDYYIHCAPIWVVSSNLKMLHDKFAFKRITAFSSTSIISKQQSSSDFEQNLVDLLQAGEQSVSAFNQLLNNSVCNWTIFRPTLIYGYGEDKNITQIKNFINKFHCFPVVGKAKGLRRPVHIDDLITATWQTLDNSACFNKTFTLSGGECLSYYQMVGRIFFVLNKKPRIISLPKSLLRLALYCKPGATQEMANRMEMDLNFSSEAAVKAFNYQARAFSNIE